MLPTLTDFKPDDSGKSALAKSEEFMHVEVMVKRWFEKQTLWMGMLVRAGIY